MLVCVVLTSSVVRTCRLRRRAAEAGVCPAAVHPSPCEPLVQALILVLPGGTRLWLPAEARSDHGPMQATGKTRLIQYFARVQRAFASVPLSTKTRAHVRVEVQRVHQYVHMHVHTRFHLHAACASSNMHSIRCSFCSHPFRTSPCFALFGGVVHLLRLLRDSLAARLGLGRFCGSLTLILAALRGSTLFAATPLLSSFVDMKYVVNWK